MGRAWLLGGLGRRGAGGRDVLCAVPPWLGAVGTTPGLAAPEELKHKHEIWQAYSRLITCVFVFTLLDMFECRDVSLWARL